VEQLKAALTANRDQIHLAVAAAEVELAECRRKCAELERILSRARLVADLDGEPETTQKTLTLHDAMLTVIADRPQGLTARELAIEVNQRGLYRRRDGRALDAVQIRARVGQYSSLFSRREGRIFASDATRP